MILKKSVPWNLIIPKLKQEISADEERQLETWLRSSNNESVIQGNCNCYGKKIQANVEKLTRPIPNIIGMNLSTVCTPASLSRLQNLQRNASN